MVGQNNSVAGGVDFNRESVQSLWREALVLRELARDGFPTQGQGAQTPS